MDPKRITPQKILWLDMEMTGLDPKIDRILEVAAIVTDWQFNELDTFESGVGQDVAATKARMDATPFFSQFPDTKRQLLEFAASGPKEADVEARVVELVGRHFPEGTPALLGGNSIHQDRQFIRQWWPNLEKTLHYRMLDVSAWKVLMQGKYGVEFNKSEKHRALDDIRESIAELKYYLEWFGKESQV